MAETGPAPPEPRPEAGAVRRLELLMHAAVGLAWGPLLFHFGRHVAPRGGALAAAGCAASMAALGALGARAGDAWFRLRAWELAAGGRAYERWMAIRRFKRWMAHGDRMNASLRRRWPAYRVVRPTRASAAAYAERARGIERAHLAWLLAALPPAAYAWAVGERGHAALWVAANLVTNAWPIALQRYNRARAAGVARR